jgi:hypothetical protein
MDTEEVAFASFVFSKAHWQEELAQVKIWANAIKKMSPSLYHEAVGAYRRNLLED